MTRQTSLGTALAIVALVLSACGGSSGPPALALGQEAVVEHADTGVAGAKPTSLAIKVTAVRNGTPEELEAGGFDLDAEDRKKRILYVDAHYENRGTETLGHRPRVSLDDQGGRLISPVTIFDFSGEGGEFAACPDRTDGPLAPGESFDSCTLFFVPTGATAALLNFLPSVPGKETDWVRWTIPSS